MDIAEFRRLLASRRSVRDFLPTPIDRGIIDEILEDAMTAPSWSNTRPYMVAVATGDQRDRLSTELRRRWAVTSQALSGSWWQKVLYVLRGDSLPIGDFWVWRPYPRDLLPRSRKIGRELYGHLGVARGDVAGRNEQWARNYDFFGAPVVLFVFVHGGLPTYAASDAGLFMENLMLSAHARGLGTCAQGALAVWRAPVRAEFDVPKHYKLLCGISLGYPSTDTVNEFRAERLPIDEIVIPSSRKP